MEVKMKFKYILLFLFTSFSLTAEEVPLIKELIIENTIETGNLYIRREYEVQPQDDITGNIIVISPEGNIYIHCRDQGNLYEVNQETKKIEFLTKTSFLESDVSECLEAATDDLFIFCGSWNRVKGVDKSFNTVFSTNSLNWSKRLNFGKVYYDEKTDVLFFCDKDENKYCIENPTLDERQNQKKFRDNEQTVKLLESGKYAPHLTADKNGGLVIDGEGYYWYGKEINHICYQYVNKNKVALFASDNTIRFNFKDEKEQVESIAFHPSGDIYILRINWEKNKHILYRVENTWDPDWRKKWFEISSLMAQTIQTAYNVVESKIMRTNDNLRLRKEEATSSEIITTMLKGTKVKIIKLGKEETIDGIKSCWVQVEVVSGGMDKNGKEIKAGTVGWCYGGFLE